MNADLSANLSANLSYTSGVSDVSLLYQTLGSALHQAAQKFPDHDAIVSVEQDVRLDYKTFNEKVTKTASGLLALGLEPGERIGIWATNCAEWAITQFAAARAGLILVNINPAYRIAELEYALNKVGCAAIVISAKFKTSNYVEMLQKIAPNLFTKSQAYTKVPSLKFGILIDDEDIKQDDLILFSSLEMLGNGISDKRINELDAELQPEDPINIQFTSGTTGAPKGATLTHHNILNNGYFVGKGIKLTDQDRICIPVPLYHCFGMVMGNIAAVTHGATMVYPSPGFEPKKTLSTVDKEKCTVLYGVPTMFIGILAEESLANYNVKSLRSGIMAGAPCPVDTMRRVLSDLHMPEVTICYGMTETSPVSFQSGVDAPIEKRVSTVGTIHPHLEVKIIDEDGKVIPVGMQGELCTRGYSVMSGYWGDDKATSEAVDSNGWMHTGDLAVLSEDGYANITGRVKDVIIRGGENIYPREIEEYIMAHEAVQDVQVFGVPDDRFGEVACAWLILEKEAKATATQIEEWCKDRFAHYKIPQYFKIVDDYPKTVTGKPQKFIMRQVMIEELCLEERATA